MKRAELKRKSMRSRTKHTGPSADVKNLLKTRNGGLCEIGLACRGEALGVDPAHREGKGSGGTSKPWSNVASNLLWACRPCHDLIDNHAVRGAERLGFKVRAGVARPWEIPLEHSRFGWVLLNDVGGYRLASPLSYMRGGHPLIPVIGCAAWDLLVQAGAFIEAMERFGHLQCPGWSAPREGLFTCGCGSTPFICEVIA